MEANKKKLAFSIILGAFLISALVYFSRVVSVKKYKLKELDPTVHKYQLNINSAQTRDFDNLPGVGPSLAERIIEYRHKYGSFENVDELVKVKGLGSKKLESIKEYVTVSVD